jgi:hypothetical protein
MLIMEALIVMLQMISRRSTTLASNRRQDILVLPRTVVSVAVCCPVTYCLLALPRIPFSRLIVASDSGRQIVFVSINKLTLHPAELFLPPVTSEIT